MLCGTLQSRSNNCPVFILVDLLFVMLNPWFIEDLILFCLLWCNCTHFGKPEVAKKRDLNFYFYHKLVLCVSSNCTLAMFRLLLASQETKFRIYGARWVYLYNFYTDSWWIFSKICRSFSRIQNIWTAAQYLLNVHLSTNFTSAQENILRSILTELFNYKNKTFFCLCNTLWSCNRPLILKRYTYCFTITSVHKPILQGSRVTMLFNGEIKMFSFWDLVLCKQLFKPGSLCYCRVFSQTFATSSIN